MKLRFHRFDTLFDAAIAGFWFQNLPFKNSPEFEELKKQPFPITQIFEEGQENVISFAIDEKNQPIAYFEFNTVPSKKNMYLREFMVSPSERGRGLGKELILLFIEDLRNNGFKALELEPTAESAQFWKKLGFVPTRPNILGIQLN